MIYQTALRRSTVILSNPGDILPVLRVAYCTLSKEILSGNGIDLGG
jgi:hypothetical protein